jgi:ABC-type transporter Mla subunit MlaD
MAEALAIVGVVASIVQLVDFSAKVVSRLDEFHSVVKEAPKSFRHVKTELPLLTSTLEQLKGAIDTTSVADGSKKALLPVIAGCNEQVAQLDAILKKTLPETNDSWWIKSKKAGVSLHNDAKVESITKALRNYVRILTFYYAAASSTLQPLTGGFLWRKLYPFHPNCL